jgi:hypothetical protein
MAYFSDKKTIVRDTSKLGVVDGNQVYDILQESTDYFREYHSIESAVVEAVYINPRDPNFPTRKMGADDVPDYSLYGTIDAVFKKGEVLPGNIKPLSNHVVTYPLKGELVNIAFYNGEYYYSMPLNLNQDINMNRAANQRGDGTVTPQRTKFNRRVFASSGDTVVQGRFGNHIKLGSDSIYENPSIRIVTGQSQTLPNVQLKNVDSKFLQMEDINNDGSSIYMTSGPEQMSPPLATAAPTHNFPQPKYLYGNQIIINSDRLVFQAKGVVYPGSNADLDISPTGCIHMLAADDFIISSGDRVVIEVPQPKYDKHGKRMSGDYAGIFLGMDADANGTGVAKGAEVIETLKGMMEVIESIIRITSGLRTVAGDQIIYQLESLKDLNKQCKVIKDYLPDIESKTVITSFD